MPGRPLKHWLSIIFTFLFFAAHLQGQTEAVAELDSVVETGDPFILDLHVPKVLGVVPDTVDFSPWSNIFPEENILSQTGWEYDAKGYHKKVSLIVFDADSNVFLPALPIKLKGGGQALTNPLQLTILPTPSPDDLRDMADIKDIRREPFNWREWLYANRQWLSAVLGVLLLALADYYFFRKRNRTESALSRSMQLPAHEYAVRRLDALEKKQLWQVGQARLYYAELTHILREYLEKRYHIPALESVSEEIFRHLHHTDFPDSLLPDLKKLLLESDLVKFAQAEPPASFHSEAMRIVREIVRETIEKQVVEPNPAS